MDVEIPKFVQGEMPEDETGYQRDVTDVVKEQAEADALDAAEAAASTQQLLRDKLGEFIAVYRGVLNGLEELQRIGPELGELARGVYVALKPVKE